MEIAGVKLEDLEFENIGSWPFLLRGFLIIAACMAAIYLGYMVELTGKIDALNSAKQKKAEVEKLFFETEQKTTHLGAYQKEVEIVEAQLNKLIEQLPSSNEEAELLEDISQEAANNNLQFVAIKPGVQLEEDFYHANPIELELSGNYNGFGDFSSKVSNMKRIVTLHDFSIKKNDTKGRGALMMVVLAKTYWVTLKEKKK